VSSVSTRVPFRKGRATDAQGLLAAVADKTDMNFLTTRFIYPFSLVLIFE
jgi:hypothetical protein